ncbi:hypothetical protein DRH14_00375, partial [Candidatus Shapirobacteria bacterium]
MSPKIIPKKYCRINNKKIAYIEAGKKNQTNLVFIHGWPVSSDMFLPVIHQLAKKFRILAPDLPGFGRSEPLNDSYTYKSFAIFLSRFLKSLNIKRTYLCGVSLGGAVAVEFTYRYPQKVTKLILNAPPLHLYPSYKNKGDLIETITKKFPS